jgi:hypothetical protein
MLCSFQTALGFCSWRFQGHMSLSPPQSRTRIKFLLVPSFALMCTCAFFYYSGLSLSCCGQPTHLNVVESLFCKFHFGAPRNTDSHLSRRERRTGGICCAKFRTDSKLRLSLIQICFSCECGDGCLEGDGHSTPPPHFILSLTRRPT